MAKLYVMVGLPGSGKSAYAKKMLKGIIVSSDDIRECLYGMAEIQSDPNRVFAFVNSITKDCLKDNRDVIYDATSLNEKTRANIIDQFSDVADEIIAIYMDTPLETCIMRNNARDRIVPENRIRDMAKSLTQPTVAEGFSEIRIIF